MDCVFCKIAKKEIPSDVVAENDSAIAFLDKTPISPGHTLVVSKDHLVSILDILDSETGPVLMCVRDTVNRLSAALSPDGFTIGINHGKAAGQLVEHLHVHILPRWGNDKGTSIHGIVNNPPKSYDEVKKKIFQSSKRSI